MHRSIDSCFTFLLDGQDIDVPDGGGQRLQYNTIEFCKTEVKLQRWTDFQVAGSLYCWVLCTLLLLSFYSTLRFANTSTHRGHRCFAPCTGWFSCRCKLQSTDPTILEAGNRRGGAGSQGGELTKGPGKNLQ